MKNILIYINPSKDFTAEGKANIKIQIDNSYDLGWKKDDIMLFTNFPYHYNGIKSLVIADNNYCEVAPQSTKTKTIVNLIKDGILGDNALNWVHDLDAFQLEKITEGEIEMGDFDMALTDYGRMPKWTTGSIFFKTTAFDIFKEVHDLIYNQKTDEENALMALTTNNLRWAMTLGSLVHLHSPIPTKLKITESINQRVKKINVTYNFTHMNIRSCYKLAVKPLRVVHFHPIDESVNGKPNMIDFFVRGKNKINTQLLPERMTKIFNNHGIK
jgi:hypothetical protein